MARNENGECDRKCFDCDLVLASKEILQAYTLAIGCIEGIIEAGETKYSTDEIAYRKYAKKRADDVMLADV